MCTIGDNNGSINSYNYLVDILLYDRGINSLCVDRRLQRQRSRSCTQKQRFLHLPYIQLRFFYGGSLCAGPHDMTVALPRTTRPQIWPWLQTLTPDRTLWGAWGQLLWSAGAVTRESEKPSRATKRLVLPRTSPVSMYDETPPPLLAGVLFPCVCTRRSVLEHKTNDVRFAQQTVQRHPTCTSCMCACRHAGATKIPSRGVGSDLKSQFDDTITTAWWPVHSAVA